MQTKCVYIILTPLITHGKTTIKSQTLCFMLLIKKCYELYFGCKVGDKDKSWAPDICNVCEAAHRIGKWFAPLAIPMVWRKPNDHSSECYFCLTNIIRVTSKSKHTVKYRDLPSARGLSHTLNSFLYQSLWKIWLLVMTTLMLTKITHSKKGTILIVI
jgi:hypothetical protein